jgi:PIN domain nuclease of toxin-antitoxin system
MKILLDTHAYFWWETNDPKLSVRAKELIAREESEVMVSAVLAWELATKGRLGRWPGARDVAADMDDALVEEGFVPLPISIEHARLAGSLLGAHRDPFDRMLAAQSQIENVPLVTADPVFKVFGTRVLW